MEEDIKIAALESYHRLVAVSRGITNALKILVADPNTSEVTLPKSTLEGIIRVLDGHVSISNKLVEHQAEIDDQLSQILAQHFPKH